LLYAIHIFRQILLIQNQLHHLVFLPEKEKDQMMQLILNQ